MKDYYIFVIGAILVLCVIIYSVYKKRQIFELSRFATIAILLFALPRLLSVLMALVFQTEVVLENFRLELTLGTALLLIRCIQEIGQVMGLSKPNDKKDK